MGRNRKFISYASAIKGATSRSMKAIRTTLAMTGADETLVVNTGETHTSPNHLLAQTDLMHALHTAGIPFAVAHEAPKNKWDLYVQRNGHEAAGSMLVDTLRHPEHKKTYDSLSQAVTPAETHCARMSYTAMSYYLHAHNIPAVLADVAERLDPERMDCEDEGTFSSLLEAVGLLGYDPETVMNEHPGCTSFDYNGTMTDEEENISMATRNIHMQRACDELSRAIEGVRVILLRTGAAHVTGENMGAYQGSLADIFTRQERPYLGLIYCTDKAEARTEADHVRRTQESPNVIPLIVPNGRQFGTINTPDHGFQSDRSESEQVLAVARHLPLGKTFGIVNGVAPYKTLCDMRDELEKAFLKTISRFQEANGLDGHGSDDNHHLTQS